MGGSIAVEAPLSRNTWHAKDTVGSPRVSIPPTSRPLSRFWMTWARCQIIWLVGKLSLGEATEGSIRTFCFVRWPGKVKPDTSSYAMFSIMDFFPTFARLIGSKIPPDRPIDGVDQTDVLFGKSETGNRDSLLTFIGADLVAGRWKQWRMYFTDVHPTGIGPQRNPGMFSASAPMAGYPKIYNIEMDPHEDLQVGALLGGRPAIHLRWSRSTRKHSRNIRTPLQAT